MTSGNGRILVLVLLLAVFGFPDSLCQEKQVRDPNLRGSDTLTASRLHSKKVVSAGTAKSELRFQGTQPRPHAFEVRPPFSDRDHGVHNIYWQISDGTSKSASEGHTSQKFVTPNPADRLEVLDETDASYHSTEVTGSPSPAISIHTPPSLTDVHNTEAGLSGVLLRGDGNMDREVTDETHRQGPSAESQDAYESKDEPWSFLGPETPQTETDEIRERDTMKNDDPRALRWADMYVSSVYDPPIDYFKCGRCKCNKDFNGNAVHAVCRLGNKHKHTFVEKLPRNTQSIDLSDCNMQTFRFEAFSSYPSLFTLVLSFNNIYVVKNNTCSQQLAVRSLDLSNNYIRVVEDYSFSCLPELRYLYLKNNELQKVTNSLLGGLPKLMNLDLSYNKIQSIENNTFDNCSGLVTLMLSHNKKLNYGEKTLSPRIFRPLKCLKTLHIQGFDKTSLVYPTSVLAELTSLEELNIDGVSMGRFDDPILLALKNMSTVKIGVRGHCTIHNVSEFYFRGFPYLKSAQLCGCSPEVISHLAFSHNIYLEDLSYINTSYPFDLIFESLSGLQDLPIKSLTINNLLKGAKNNPCRYLTGKHVQHIRKMRNLERLSLESNEIALIEYGFVDGLPGTLKQLSLRKNVLRYLKTLLWTHGQHQLQNLTVLQEDFQNHMTGIKFGDIEEFYTDDDASVDPTPTCISETASNYPKPQNIYRERNDTSLIGAVVVPPKLRVYTSVESFHFGLMLLSPNIKENNVRHFNISSAVVSDWGSKDLSPWIEIADLSNNFCDFLSLSFFRINNSLKEFHVAGNFLGSDFAKDYEGEKLSRLRGVHYVDLSRNHIQELPWRFFKGLVAVKVINLSDNNIKTLNVSMAHMRSLTFLNLNKNSITWISRQSRHDLDSIALDHQVILDLTSNPLPCTCEGIEMIKWLATTKVRVINKDFLQCHDEDNTKQYIGDLLERTMSLQRSCASKAYVVLAATFCTVVVIMLTVSVWVFRNRWWLYYMRNILIARFFGYKRHDGDQVQHYQFDAFIHYSNDESGFVMRECLQELEEKRKHKVCVEHRDFLLGSYMPCTITNAISNSRVTVAVVSPQFWEGEWSEYGLQMAVMESVHTKRSVLHLLIYKPVDMKDMPRNILKVYNDNEFSEYPPEDCDEIVKRAFWDAISRVIGHSNGIPANVPEI